MHLPHAHTHSHAQAHAHPPTHSTFLYSVESCNWYIVTAPFLSCFYSWPWEATFADCMLMVLVPFDITKTRLFKYIDNFTSKNWKISDKIKISDIFQIFAQNIDCGYSLEPPWRGGSNEYPQSMFLSRNKENNIYPCKPQFYFIKVGFKGVKII